LLSCWKQIIPFYFHVFLLLNKTFYPIRGNETQQKTIFLNWEKEKISKSNSFLLKVRVFKRELSFSVSFEGPKIKRPFDPEFVGITTRREMEQPSDAMTRSSADDALAGKSAACKLGYLCDPFVATMLVKSHGAVSKSMRKRQPIINRGYYARVEAIRVKFTEFVKSQGERKIQVINLGCGFDTLSLEMLDQCNASGRDMTIFEVDFSEVVHQKAEYILQEPVLSAPLFRNELAAPSTAAGVRECMGPPSSSSSRSAHSRASWAGTVASIGSSDRFNIIGCDLRNAPDVTQSLLAAGFDPAVPTAILSECTLVYMESRHAAALCSALGDMLSASTPAVWISYDMTHSQDIYGKVMLRNLSSAGYAVPSFTQLPTLTAHQQLFAESGWGDPSARVQVPSGGAVNAKKKNYFDSVFKRNAADFLVRKTLVEGANEEEEEEEGDKKGPQPSSGSENAAQDISVAMDADVDSDVQAAPSSNPLPPAGQGAVTPHSFGKVESITMLQAWDMLVSPEEKARVSKLEIFDEIEEWNMLMSHYCLTTACRNVRLPY